MITAWRVVKEKRASEAFLGEGPRRFSGRWNHKGTAVVYVSETLSLAVLEQFIHLGREGMHIPFVFFKVEIPDHVSVAVLKDLPKDWRHEPPPDSTKGVGSKWAESKSSLALCVPSVIIPTESNYLINIHHPEFNQILIHDPEPFSFDPRMWK